MTVFSEGMKTLLKDIKLELIEIYKIGLIIYQLVTDILVKTDILYFIKKEIKFIKSTFVCLLKIK